MRIFKGLLRLGAYLVALSGCQDAMKGSEIYPTTDNLIEIEPDRIKIIEAKDIAGGVFLIIGGYTNRQCEINIANATLKEGIAISSIEVGDKIKARCLWQGEEHIQTKKYLTPITPNINEFSTIDIQVYSPKYNQYLAITATDLQLPVTTNKP
ncbi:hypothetical protein MJO52_05375 [Microbulbifer variabilis]|uniref:Lipoprotein n=1 Tax=Microbulbifer variabilis TaxID=266805 RepID=A0ABY4VE35_9GAMM|nr:hypothetical protein [Microbulbifer variabilis]USD22564.1 hypothetical protein MJO52_05375 [Microbulbifer variabilis]